MSSVQHLLKRFNIDGSMKRKHSLFKGKNDQVPDYNIFNQTSKQLIKVMVSDCLTWYGATNHFLLMDVRQKWMHNHTNYIFRKNFYLLFNAFIYLKTGFLYKTMYHHTIQTSCMIFYKKHSIHVFVWCQYFNHKLLIFNFVSEIVIFLFE